MNPSGHINILQKILDLGGRVNLQDVGGRTPLSHCLGVQGDDPTLLTMGRMLLEKGANPNIPDRLGSVPLSYCASGGDGIEKAGAYNFHSTIPPSSTK